MANNLSTSQQLRENAQGYLQQGQAQSVNPLSNPNSYLGQGTINQQSFAMPGSVPVNSIPATPPGPTYVPGFGFLGPDLGGAVKGAQAAQEYQMNAAANQRANEQLGMSKVKLAQDQDYLNIAKEMLGINLNKASMETQTFEKQQAIEAGMTQAAQNGGLPGVIDYLTSADPEKAITFQAAKLKLEAGFMENQTYQMAHQNDKAEAMMASYAAMGKFGAAIMNAPAEKREALYQGMLPIMKQFYKDMPDELDGKAVAALGAGMAMSTPAATLYSGQKNQLKYQSTAGQIVGDIHSAAEKYGVDSQEVKVLQQALTNNQALAEKNQLQMANTIASNQAQGESGLRNQWISITKDISQMAQSYNAVQQSNQSIKDDKGAEIQGPNDMAMIYNYYKMLDPNSVIMPGEYANAENTAGWSDQMRQQYNKVTKGGKLSQNQRDAFQQSAATLYNNKLGSYNVLKSQFTDIAKNHNYNPDNVIIDRVGGYNTPQPSQASVNFLLQNPTPENQQQFQLRYGQDMKNKVMSQLQQSQSAQQPQQGMGQ